MLMCSKCGKRPAVVFISQMNGVQQNDNNGLGKGLCIVCAREAGRARSMARIKPGDFLKKEGTIYETN